MLSSFFGLLGGGEETKEEEQVAPKLPLVVDRDHEKLCLLNASPASTTTPGGKLADSPFLASPGSIRAPPGLDQELPAVPNLPLFAREGGADTEPTTPLKVSLADALSKKIVDPSTPVVSLADALPELGLDSDVKAPVDGTPVVSLAEALPEPEVGTEELPTIGSRGHKFGMCKPCAFLHTKGCKNGTDCRFCHLCERGEKKQRRRERWQHKQLEKHVEKQIEYAFEQQAQVVSAVMTAAATMPLMPLMPYPMLAPMMDTTLVDPTAFYLEAPTPISLADGLAAPQK